MPRPVQLHVMLSEEEMSSLRSLADSLGTTVSDTVRLLARAGAVAKGGAAGGALMLDHSTLAAYVRNVRSLGHLSTSRPTPSTRSPRRFASPAWTRSTSPRRWRACRTGPTR